MELGAMLQRGTTIALLATLFAVASVPCLGALEAPETCDGNQPCHGDSVGLLQRSVVGSSKPITLDDHSPNADDDQRSYMAPSAGLAGKSVYLIMTDRFDRSGGFSAGDQAECSSSSDWCNGTLKGITRRLEYIKGMGFDCIWVTPPVKNYDGYDGQSGYGYAGYWAEDWYDIDPHFGSKEDLKTLVKGVHDHGMCFILDIVLNHVRPIHSVEDMAKVNPFNETAYVHQLGIGNMTFGQYTEKKANWPPPTQALAVGAACAVQNLPDGSPDWTNGGNYCNNFNPSNVYDANSFLGKEAPGPYSIKYCGPGNYICDGYNETVNHEGWFYDLGDLNQSVPFVREELKKWAVWMATEYDIDGIRLDTAPFMQWDFLREVQERLASLPKPMEIIGEVTSTNISFHASFQKLAGKNVLAGMENFPLEYLAQPGYCGWPNSPSAPISTFDLEPLGKATTEQQNDGLYTNVDLLMNFMDNQDNNPVASLYATPGAGFGEPGTGGCLEHESLVRNSLVWVMFARGMPVISWGDEQGNTVYRNSLWQFGWKTDTWQYKFIARMNQVRREVGMALAPMAVVEASRSKFAFRRGTRWCCLIGRCRNVLWVYTNNLVSMPSCGTITYPAPPGRLRWYDAFTGDAVHIRAGNVITRSTEPLVLSRRRFSPLETAA